MSAFLALASCAVHTEPLEETPAVFVEDPQASAPQIPFPDLAASNDKGFSIQGLAARSARMQQFVDEGDAAGVTGLLVKDGKVVQYDEFGIMRAETDAPIRADTIHRIYSMTKPITGVAMMMLYEDGAFELDDPITKYIPEFEGLKVLGQPDENGNPSYLEAERVATMRDLMAHRAGFGYGFDPTDSIAPGYAEAKVILYPDLPTYVDRLSEQPLMLLPD